MSAHKKALKTIKQFNSNAKVGMTHALQEWEDDDDNKLKEYLKYHLEDKFLEASLDDDFIGSLLSSAADLYRDFILTE